MRNLEYAINLDFVRPDPDAVRSLLGIPAANICDCQGRLTAMESALMPMNGSALLGPAFTVKVPEGDNLMVHIALDLAQPGDVIVVDAGGSANRAIIGELMARYAEEKRIGGFVIDGAVRDAASLARMRIPVYATAVTPAGPYKNGPGSIGLPVSVGGQAVCPGDILVGDGDGVVVVRPDEVEALLPAVRALMDREAKTLADIAERCEFSRPWLEAAMRERGLKA